MLAVTNEWIPISRRLVQNGFIKCRYFCHPVRPNNPTTTSADSQAWYRNDPQALARWLDVSVIKRRGKVYEADAKLIPVQDDMFKFPSVEGTTLKGADVKFPDSVDAKAKFICFSFKAFGFHLIRSWVEPFIKEFPRVENPSVKMIEISFVEFGFLSLAKNVFISNLKTKVAESQQDLTLVSFGNLMRFASILELPNKYTGYAYLLDSQNRVRWRATGTANPHELQGIFA